MRYTFFLGGGGGGGVQGEGGGRPARHPEDQFLFLVVYISLIREFSYVFSFISTTPVPNG